MHSVKALDSSCLQSITLLVVEMSCAGMIGSCKAGLSASCSGVINKRFFVTRAQKYVTIAAGWECRPLLDIMFLIGVLVQVDLFMNVSSYFVCKPFVKLGHHDGRLLDPIMCLPHKDGEAPSSAIP